MIEVWPNQDLPCQAEAASKTGVAGSNRTEKEFLCFVFYCSFRALLVLSSADAVVGEAYRWISFSIRR